MAKISFAPPLEFGSSENLKLLKVHSKEVEWKTFPLEDFVKLKMADFFSGKLRFVIECKIDGNTCRLATHHEDYLLIKKKYPKQMAVDLRQILMLWKYVPDAEEDLPRVLIACAVLDAKVMAK